MEMELQIMKDLILIVLIWIAIQKSKTPKKKGAFISLREAYPNLDCYYQIIDLDKDVLWEAGYFERENTSPNPLTNLTSETKYTASYN